jgi:DNA-binding SARP family transcriptional activator
MRLWEGESPVPVRVEFGLLGPLTVRSWGAALPIAQGRQRALLAALLLDAGHVVTVGQLTDVLWGPAPPTSARAALHNQVRRLRDALGELGRDRVRTQPGGYLIRLEPGELDVTRVQSLLASARIAARGGAWDQASALAANAVLLWRGEPLADVGSEVLARRIPHLTEIYLQAVETRLDAEVHLGRHAEAISELRRLTSDQPFREHLHALLMLALYRSERQGEALAAYQAVRRTLIAELGSEPGPELQRVHQQILHRDPALAAPEPTAPSPAGATAAGSGPVPVVSRELPGAIRHLTGRAPELVTLTRPLDARWNRASAVAVTRRGSTDGPGHRAGGPQLPRHLPAAVPGFVGRRDQLVTLSQLLCQPAATAATAVISGSPGAGKTALAVQWAHQAADRFPDGQLYVDLLGYGAGQPVSAADALAGLLRALGVAGPDIPDSTTDRAAAYRSLLAGKRILVVLDNARESAQVRPLLPGSTAGAVLVTSRDALAGLVAREGVVRLELDSLSLADAMDLLRALIGARVSDDPAAAAALASYCSRLPLALRVAAELAVAHPAVSLASLAGQLADLRDRLDRLDAGGDEQTAVRSVLSWSYRRLGPSAARAFDLLGHHPGADFDGYATAALTGTGHGEADRLLDQLARAYLIQSAGPGRYVMHDLLRAYAREHTSHGPDDQSARKEAEGRRAALNRLFEYYLYTASAAADALHPARRHQWPHRSPAGICAPPMDGVSSARAWLETELGNLLAAIVTMTDDGWADHAARLAATIGPYLESAGRMPEAITVHGHAMRASRLAGDGASEATALGNLGYVLLVQGRYQSAADHLRRAIPLFRQAGDKTGEATALGNLAVIDRRLARYQQAARRQAQALALYRQAGDQWGEALALTRLGGVERRLGRLQQAEDHLREALALSGRIGDPIIEAEALTRLGVVEKDLGHYQQAVEHHQRAVAMFRRNCALRGEAEALNGLGEVLLAMERPGDALCQHTAARELTERAGGLNERARAHHGLALAHQAVGSQYQAACHFGEAMNLYSQLGAPEADQIRVWLAVGPC